jgi:tRNA (cytosine49-C5)-methyltransferase
LLHNKGKYALNNVIVKRMDVRNLNDKFDKIILDAPCSSEGLVRKKRGALKNWSQTLVERKAIIQKELLLHCFELLKNGGELVYSTCSFSPEENEEVILYLLKNKKNAIVEKVELDGIKIRENELCKNCVRLWPQDNNTQQFFIAKIKKTNGKN